MEWLDRLPEPSASSDICNHGTMAMAHGPGSATCGTAYKSRRRDVAVGSSAKRRCRMHCMLEEL